MPFSRRNVEKLGISLPPPDDEPDDSGLGFLRDDIGSPPFDGDWDSVEPPRTQSVLSLLSWGDDEFERQSTREVQHMLEDVDRLLYDGETSETMSPALADECRLWSKRFPHLRMVGRRLTVLPSRPAERAVVRVALLTEEGPVDEETAACLRHPGQPETICSHGLSPAAPAPAPADRPTGGGGGVGGSAEVIQDPAALIAEMVTNSLVSQLWADYVRTMTPVFQSRDPAADQS
ncbi:Protein FAM149B1 [Amphibalanus amphitrite]|uniref:Protein FAM149B1 n=1 Tax=Amphibalanus amphitrite TaxID=1232801 RepID=A0A6A4V3V6_AMPAM|nr:Protein FAM149B1 [Amphibalanus amphitrite]